MKLSKILLLSTLLALPLTVSAQRRPELIGEMDLDSDEDTSKGFSEKQFGSIELQEDEVKIDPYTKSENDAIAYIKNVQDATKTMLVAPKEIAVPNDLTLQHIANAYLFCSIKKGICPEYLQTLREADVINAIANPSNTTCKTMKAFWGVWKVTNMQRKLDHQVKLSQISQRNEFNRTILPNFHDNGCAAYLEQINSSIKKDRDATIKNRYKSDGTINKAVTFVYQMLQFFKKKHINLTQSVLPR